MYIYPKHFKMNTDLLLSDFSLKPVTASEIEFYLFGSEEKELVEFWGDVKEECAKADISIYKIEKERGHEQYEISLVPCYNPKKTGDDTNNLKNIVLDLAVKYRMQASFAAKPLADDFGNGLHINIHLEDANGKNQFYKKDEIISDILNYALGGLLLWMPDTMPIFAPTEESYKRFADGSNAPLTVSWGANNRTTALRLPDSAHDNKRIEHRVAGADADANKVIEVILAAIHYGIANKIKPPAQIYGDARLPTYNCERFATSLQEATRKMQNSPFSPFKILLTGLV